jgi:hypothetical protein
MQVIIPSLRRGIRRGAVQEIFRAVVEKFAAVAGAAQGALDAHDVRLVQIVLRPGAFFVQKMPRSETVEFEAAGDLVRFASGHQMGHAPA